MSDGFQFIDIIILAMVAGFIALRLRSVLGRRTGHEREHPEASDRFGGAPEGKDQAPAGPIQSAPTADYRFILKSSSPAFDGIDAISRRDPAFTPEGFAQGAREAYEMILEGFWHGDREAFQPFVSRDIYAGFDQAITAREAAGEQVRNSLEKVRTVEITEAGLEGDIARISVRFVSDVILMTVDKEGRVSEGNPVDTVDVTDLWTFERDLSRSDPNWTLIATRSED